MLAYSLNSTVSRLQRNDHMHNASVSGTAGANLGAWRMRTDLGQLCQMHSQRQA